MNAKEYAAAYLKDDTPEAIGRVVFNMLMEVKDIAEKRHAKSDYALFAILDEMDKKWRAFVEIIEKDKEFETIRRDGFEFTVSQHMTDVWRSWMNYKQGIQNRR